MAVEGPPFGVIDIEDVIEGSDDQDVGRVGSRGRVILVGEALEESCEYRMVCCGSMYLLSGIEETQVGEPLAHRQKGFVH